MTPTEALLSWQELLEKAEQLERDKHHVRRVYREVWDKYHQNKPDDLRAVRRSRSSGIAKQTAIDARKAMHARLESEKHLAAKEQREKSSLDPSSPGPSKLAQPWSRPRNALPTETSDSSYRRLTCEIDPDNLLPVIVPSSKEPDPVERLVTPPTGMPRYDWCAWTGSCRHVPSEAILPFRVDEMTGEELEAYESGFKCGSAWERGYGGPADLHIMLETVERLGKEGFSESVIDRTRALSKTTYDLHQLRCNMDTYAFPRPGQLEWIKEGKVDTGEAIGETDRRERVVEATKGERSWCRMCGTFFCDRHNPQGHHPVGPEPPPNPQRLELDMPIMPCSPDCAFYLNSSDLAVGPTPEHEDHLPASITRFGKDQTVTLKALLEAAALDPDDSYTYCEAAEVTDGTTCRTVSETAY